MWMYHCCVAGVSASGDHPEPMHGAGERAILLSRVQPAEDQQRAGEAAGFRR